MSRTAAAFIAAGSILIGAATVVTLNAAGDDAEAITQPPVTHIWVEPGDTWADAATACGSTAAAIRVANYLATNAAIRVNSWLHCPLVVAPPPTTTLAPTTTAATTSTTVAPTTTSSTLPATTTTSSTSTSTTAASTTTTTVPSGAQFVETFDTAAALDRLAHGVYHRDNVIITQTQWPGDHSDLGTHNCGDPTTTSRTIHRSAPDESFYVCEAVNGDSANGKGHLMSSVGDTSGYSIAWFKPIQTFNGQSVVSWDANVTYLGTTRQWWEVIITPTSAPDLQCDAENTACGLGTQGYAPGTVAFTYDMFYANGVSHDPWGWQNYCFQSQNIDPEGCASKSIRRTFTLTDNHNNTITVNISGVNRTYTYPGKFPTGDWKVVFKAHAYTPTKGDGSGCGGPCPGYTWHWDNIIVR